MRRFMLFALLTFVFAPVAHVSAEQRALVCNITALSKEQRERHNELTKRLLAHARRQDLNDGYSFTLDRERVSVAELAEWVADESRCCPALDFHLTLPAAGPLTLRIGGGTDVKSFLAVALGLSTK